MPKYSKYFSDVYTSDEQIERLLEKYGPVVEKYRPGGDLDWKISQAKIIANEGEGHWKWKWASARVKVLEEAYAKDSSAKNFARLYKFKLSSILSTGEPAVKRDEEFFGGGFGAMRKGKGQAVYFGSKDPKGAHEFKGSGMGGSPILIVKHGTDLAPTGFENAEIAVGKNSWKKIECWNVGDETAGALQLVQTLGSGKGSLAGWLDANANRYLCSFWLPLDGDGSTIDPMTGQPAIWSDVDNYTIGVEAESFKGFIGDADQYEVIDVGFTVFKFAVEGFAKMLGGAAAAIAPPPEIVEHIKQAKELYEVAEKLGITEKAAEALKKYFEAGEPPMVAVTFSATAGGASLNCGKTVFRNAEKYGYGVKVGDIKGKVLAAAAG
jgi:hypothetical protein